NLVSVEQEAQVGATFAREIEKKKRLARDPAVRRYVSELGLRLAEALPRSEFRYRFRVLEDPEVNAFNIGGGWIYVNTGLLAAARTEGELVAVLAHEMGHQVKRHVAKAISRDQMFRSLASFAVGGQSQWVQLAAALGVTTGQLHFGREGERQADRVMVDLMLAANYDPRQALAMFDTIRRVQGGSRGGGIFSSHPPTKERAQNVQKLIAQHRVSGRLASDSRQFHEAKARVTGRR
ncbi:MAG: M48 family metalloprotease, partial [Candidatus Binatia bacterium]